MPDHRGIFIVLEGADGSGKTTQFNLLAERLRAVGYDVQIFDFPRYNQNSSHFVKKYLNGEYGPAGEINPYTASLFYALDRYEAADGIREALQEGRVVLSNRYVGSNMAHQGSKFTSEAEQRGFFVWDDSLEYQLLGVPRPNLNIFLRVPAEISYQLISRKARRSYTAKKRDEHEGDLGHLQRAVATYDSICRLFPRDFIAIDCVKNNRLLSILTINERIWHTIQPLLTDAIVRFSPKPTTIRLDETRQMVETRVLAPKTTPVAVAKNTHLHSQSASLLCWRSLAQYSHSSPNSAQQSKLNKSNYYVPVSLPAKTLSEYKKTMDIIDRNQRQVYESLKTNKFHPSAKIKWTLKMLQPLAKLTTVDYHLSQANLNKLSQELAWGGVAELKAVAKKIPNGLLPTPISDSFNKTRSADLFKQSLESLSKDHSVSYPPATLNNFQPRAEFELLAYILFEFSGLSKTEISDMISSWDYQYKASVFKTALQKPELINAAFFEKLEYEWDLLLDGPSLEYLSTMDALGQVNSQKASPRYGYDTPEVIDKAGLDDVYSNCYDASLKLFSILQTAGLDDEAQYAVLYGHKQRYQVTTSYTQLKNIWDSTKDDSAPDGLRIVAKAIFEALSDTHPLIASTLTTDTARQEVKSERKTSKKTSQNSKSRPGAKATKSTKKSSQRARRKTK